MVDFGNDFNVIGAIIVLLVGMQSERFGEIAQVGRPTNYRFAQVSLQFVQVACTEPGKVNAVDMRSHAEVTADPGSGRQGGHRNRQHGNF